jgi:ribosome-binding ATPase YchF (GTP1/OBG family)
LEKIKTALENEVMAHTVALEDVEKPLVAQLNLLTMKPMLYALNTSSASENKIQDVIKELPGPYVEIDPVFETGFDEMIKACYKLLNLETYFTTGVQETRAWTIKIGSTAPIAGTAIHTDFKDKFIRAEVVFWKDLLDAGSYAEARNKGLVRTEGKEYIVKDGDVIEFRI